MIWRKKLLTLWSALADVALLEELLVEALSVGEVIAVDFRGWRVAFWAGAARGP